MQTVEITKNLSVAINCLEELLNENDGEMVIETIKKFKEQKNAKIELTGFGEE